MMTGVNDTDVNTDGGVTEGGYSRDQIKICLGVKICQMKVNDPLK